jgi:hypothetical protein
MWRRIVVFCFLWTFLLCTMWTSKVDHDNLAKLRVGQTACIVCWLFPFLIDVDWNFGCKVLQVGVLYVQWGSDKYETLLHSSHISRVVLHDTVSLHSAKFLCLMNLFVPHHLFVLEFDYYALDCTTVLTYKQFVPWFLNSAAQTRKSSWIQEVNYYYLFDEFQPSYSSYIWFLSRQFMWVPYALSNVLVPIFDLFHFLFKLFVIPA